MNTPDTELERQLRIDFEVAYGSMPENFEHVPSVHISDWWLEKLSSRDTYWKERVRKEGIVQGIELARKYMRSSQEECMCNEKNHNQFDRLLKGEFEGFTPTPITNEDNIK